MIGITIMKIRKGLMVSHLISGNKAVVLECNRQMCIVSTGLATYARDTVDTQLLQKTED